jgi:hypothetical protein
MEFNLTPLQWNSVQLNSTEHLCNGIQLNTFAMEFSSTQLEHLCNGIQFNSTQLNTFVMEFSSTQLN